MTRPCQIYVSRAVMDMLKAKKELIEADCVDTVADDILHGHLENFPGVEAVVALQKQSRTEYERKLAELVKSIK